MNAEAQAAVSRLAQYRLDHNLTFQELADEMAARDIPIPARSLHLALTGRVIPMERTQHRIKQFVSLLDGRPPRRVRRRARPAA